MLTLYTFFRSSAAFRVRIGLELKQLPYHAVPVHLARGGGEHLLPAYTERNPAQLVPALDTDGVTLTQSLAILEYLEETHPHPPLLPADPIGRARVRGIALAIACDIHPLNNLRVLRYLNSALNVGEELRNTWYRHWIETGFAAIEAALGAESRAHPYCHGDAPTIADCCLVPQVFNAKRLQVPLAPFPSIMRVHDNCMRLDAFRRAAPQSQPDAE